MTCHGGTRIGYLTTYSREEAEWAANSGFSSLELLCPPGAALDPTITDWTEIQSATDHLAGLDLQVSAIGYYANHLDPDPELRQQNNEYFIGIMDLAVQMGVKTVCSLAGRDPDKDIRDNMVMFKAVWTPLVAEAEKRGLRIGIENCPKFKGFPYRGINLAYTPEAWDLMFEAIPSATLGLEWDPAHLVCQMIDYVDTIYRYGHRIVHVHAKDAEVIWRNVQREGIMGRNATRHRTPGLGDINWGKVFSALREVNYTGNFDIEGLKDPVFHGPTAREGLLISLKHLQQYAIPEYQTASLVGG